ncbi:hypothetical protein D8B26_000936 [Coccidioides posadasii str. Silveira]|uniref:Acyltransferase 3 domain-containing protein n=3 Tax=Coccidioides posadasii TaxID=199306 RepID=E9CR38_COCPS|nr:Acyltransferase family protein [Coccidioides posadasii C735 delta SOWgp]EER28782.1 Acyltransferase family protein [Coccidioides posadasii C735 delta SOWgp]EFW22373.1 conserved hypothetical protein [Coccidioides posadasii str. Silveira]KMM64081.1 hypothetical protein CPAG_00433 [Coccidioides posadasii RMSCC 3488]QVM06224.1 hypothetical protein D8B26_000936 [Coccidioides posadasii str. Silveira]|eukprot:XP_003070927.1 Acyltransferase family protein [Coccidioides posadasii C735 delta SOWgp]
MPPKKRDDNWIDGLRGVASFVVVTGHLCTAFVPYLHSPALSENGPMSLWQLPILRLCVGGRGAVAVFFIITGFVNSINPVKNARNNNTQVALTNLARSSFTRSGRLVIPTSIATIIGWFLCQVGAFKLAKRADAGWIMNGGHDPDPLGESLVKLFRSLTIYWSSGGGEYDATNWTLVYFLQGSFRVYLALLAMTLVTARFWRIITAFLYAYAWITGDYLVGINLYAGILLAQLQVDYGSRATNILPKVVPSILMILGLFFWSFPQENPHWAPWSKIMRDSFVAVTPLYTDTSRYCVSVGITLLMLGIFFSKNARKFFTSPVLNFLGRVSFPVYLLHNTIIRTVLVLMVYGPNVSKTPATDDKGNPTIVKRISPMSFLFVLPVFYAILYVIAYLWTVYVDPLCAKMVDAMKNRMFVEEQKPQDKVVPLTQVA